MRTFTTLGLLALGILAGCYTPGVNEDKLAEKIGSAVGSKLASASVETNAKLDGLGTLIASSSAANKPLTAAELTTALSAALKPTTPATTDSTATPAPGTTTTHKVEISGMNVRKIDGATVQLSFEFSDFSPKTFDSLVLGVDFGNGVVATKSVTSYNGLPEYFPNQALGAGTFKIKSAMSILKGTAEPIVKPGKLTEITLEGTGSVAVPSPTPTPTAGTGTTPTKLVEGQALTKLAAAAADRKSWALTSLLAGVWKSPNATPLTDAQKAAIQDGVLAGTKKLGIVGSQTLEGAPLTADLVTYNAASASAIIAVPPGTGNGRIVALTGSVIDAVLDEAVIQGNSGNYFFLSPVGQWRLQWNAAVALQNQ